MPNIATELERPKIWADNDWLEQEYSDRYTKLGDVRKAYFIYLSRYSTLWIKSNRNVLSAMYSYSYS